MDVVIGKNPVIEALNSSLQINRVSFSKDINRKEIQEIIKLCEEKKVPYNWVDREKLDEHGKAHQGVMALISSVDYASLYSLIHKEGLIILLDGITDPHNLGAIIRSAHSFGAQGLVIAKRRSASLDAISFKASAGAAAHLPVARVSNLKDAIDSFKSKGYWVYGADGGARTEIGQIDFPKKTLLVMGSEDKGISRLVEEACDELFRIPMGEFESLNVSVASGIACYNYYLQHR
ncbi:MAG: 23S rRNA (guanosine(2251)-2'-O)-methyltransferase RlmB [Tissierellia bacterium]|nr:23S rRNA (guanosine(2251)-2'-O)-methyltransferase RlmB [Tissierellia bacterium]